MGEIKISTVLLFQFSILSLIAFGGASSVVPEIYRQTTQLHPWLTETELTSFFALSQVVPGPNVMVVALIGWKTAGFFGAMMATLGMCGPSSLVALAANHWWDRLKTAPWRKALLAGLNSVTIGFIAASAFLMAKSADRSLIFGGITLGTAMVLYFKKLNPLWLIGIGGLIGGLAGQ